MAGNVRIKAGCMALSQAGSRRGLCTSAHNQSSSVSIALEAMLTLEAYVMVNVQQEEKEEDWCDKISGLLGSVSPVLK